MPLPKLSLTRLIVALFVLQAWIILSEYTSAIAGECLESKEQMLQGYREQISTIVNEPVKSKNDQDYDFGWITYCWDASNPNDKADRELGQFLISVQENSRVPQKVKIINLDIARYTALINVFPRMVQFLKQTKNREEYTIIYVTLLNIWVKHAKTSPEIAQFNYIKLYKETSHGIFAANEKSELECKLNWAMSKVYPFDYPVAKKILQDNDFFQPNTCFFGLFFQDPRAFEDAGFKEYNYRSRFFRDKSELFASMARHLELEFKRNWLEKLGADELRVLRNAIIATYGWKFKDPKLKSLFAYEDRKVYCRNGNCDRASNNYSDNFLTDVDKKNITLIQEIEKKAPLHQSIIDTLRVDPPLPYQLQQESLL